MFFFSIVIPLYNKENFIGDTLNSVLSQTFTNFEVIVVNDFSTDNSIEIVKKIKDERIKVINHPVNKGLSASRNTGIKNASSEYIAFIDADDLWKPEFLENIKDLILKFPDASLYATKFEELHMQKVIIEHKFNTSSGLVDNFFYASLNQSIYHPSSLSVKKEVFEKVGYYDETITFAEDLDFNIRAHLSYKMAYCNLPLMQYRIYSENQITHSGLKNKVITDFDKYEALYPERKDLKKFLDFHRYVTAKLYKINSDNNEYKKMCRGINLKNLNYKQIILLYSPAFILKAIKKTKRILVKKGLNPTTY